MKQRRQQYVLRAKNIANTMYIAPCLNGKTQATETIANAEKFDDRDNLEMKCRFQKACTGMEWEAVPV